MSDPRAQYWRELAESAGGLDRREFVRLLGACLALAGLDGCVRRPRQPILPYVGRPLQPLATEARHYATSMTLDGYATGLLVESHAGRPTKIEGNPDHPASLGAAGAFEQASLLGLYDPQRARTVRNGGRRSSWAELRTTLGSPAMSRAVGARGTGLHLLLEPTASPFLLGLVALVRDRYPECRVHWDAPLGADGSHLATAALLGKPVQPVYDLTAARVLLSVDADLLGSVPFGLRYAHDFAAGRRPGAGSGMSRLYVMETAPSVTGGMADHRLALRPSRMAPLMRALAARVAEAVGAEPPAQATELPGPIAAWARALGADLAAHRGQCAVAVGERQPAEIHGLAHWLNVVLGNEGRTVRYIEPPLAPVARDTDLAALAESIRGGQVACLAILEGNPVYTAPPALDFASLLGRVGETVYLGLYRNETARACRRSVPGQHYLEMWGDGRAWDGTLSPVQPLVDPLFGGHGPAELLAALAGATGEPHALLRADWERRRSSGASWDEALQRGAVEGSAAPAVPVRLVSDPRTAIARLAASAGDEGTIELSLVRSNTIHDGRFGNNPWLQELPDPVTKLTWANAAWLSPATASRHRVDTGRMVTVSVDGREVTLPAVVVPGHADDVITIALGYGRSPGGTEEGVEQVAAGVGANGYELASSRGQEQRPVSLRVSSDRVDLPITQEHWRLEGRQIALHATMEELRRRPAVSGEQRRPLTLYQPEHPPAQRQWAMVVDLSACTGCSACVVACQAENNIPVVGPDGVRKSREMHWLRLDRYYAGTAEDPVVLSQPMLCQQCEKAPCEYVCPVAATVHSPDGINEMVYNRCVGTRFCSNNCPYKVRRFNWFDYNAEVSETERLAKNPDVTVRARGVMEKCTFCVQRIREAEIAARVEGRLGGPGEVRTACQQSCPTRAITFGSLTEAGSEVTRLWEDPRGYAALEELGTLPRVRYLARITNPNPDLPGVAG
ncbi:MAG TPA: 4Fe-4S dicluster domain-containing protein [Gemmatimonadales bacterium]|nr:4Fe-4S dicluster domain-containing protein [Gemmatimonadales bacterium]